MTLAAWIAETGATVQDFGTDGARQVFDASLSARFKWSLYHLEDYVVSSRASGPSAILVPRIGGGVA